MIILSFSISLTSMPQTLTLYCYCFSCPASHLISSKLSLPVSNLISPPSLRVTGPTQEKMVPIVGQAMSVLIGCLKDPTPMVRLSKRISILFCVSWLCCWIAHIQWCVCWGEREIGRFLPFRMIWLWNILERRRWNSFFFFEEYESIF